MIAYVLAVFAVWYVAKATDQQTKSTAGSRRSQYFAFASIQKKDSLESIPDLSSHADLGGAKSIGL
jgi:hypothetical protein